MFSEIYVSVVRFMGDRVTRNWLRLGCKTSGTADRCRVFVDAKIIRYTPWCSLRTERFVKFHLNSTSTRSRQCILLPYISSDRYKIKVRFTVTPQWHDLRAETIRQWIDSVIKFGPRFQNNHIPKNALIRFMAGCINYWLQSNKNPNRKWKSEGSIAGWRQTDQV